MKDKLKGFGPYLVALIAIALALISFGRLGEVQVMADGDTNLTNLVLSGDLTVGDEADITGEVTYGTNDLAILGYGSEGEQLVTGTDEVTATLEIDHGLSTVTFCLCTLGVDADTDAGDPVVCTTSVAANVCTVKLWQDDWNAAATASQDVHWLVVGTP